MSRFPMTVVSLMALATAGTLQTPGLHAQEPPTQEHTAHEQLADSVVAEVARVHEDSLTVRSEDGVHMTFLIESDTRVDDSTGRIAEADTKTRIAKLDTGDRVVIHFREGDNPRERVATTIKIQTASAEQVRQQDQQQQREQVRLQEERQREQARQQEERQREQQVRQQDQLPATSSNLPLVALLGMLGMMAGAGMVFWVRREN